MECNAVVVAFDGPPGSGKTSLIHHFAAVSRVAGTRVGVVEEATRRSFMIEDVLLRGARPSVELEAHILGLLHKEEQEVKRHHELVLCDRSAVNVAGYAQKLLTRSSDARMVEGFEAFAAAYATTYDMVVYVSDAYDAALTGDDMRFGAMSEEDALAERNAVDEALRLAYERAGVELLELPRGLTLQDKADWLDRLVAPLLESSQRHEP